MQAYEYKVLEAMAPVAGNQQLNEFGAEGWQLQSVYFWESTWYYVFIRPKPSH